MVGLQTLDLAIGVRVPASQFDKRNNKRAALMLEPPVLCAYSVPTSQRRPSTKALLPVPNVLLFDAQHIPCASTRVGLICRRRR